MSLISSVFRSDIVSKGADRMMVNWPSVTHSPEMVEATFHLEHGMSREQWKEMRRVLDQEQRDGIVVADLEGEPPAETVGSWIARGNVPPQRIRLARFVAWREREASAFSDLVKARARLMDVVQAPIDTQRRIGEVIKAGASRLLAAIAGKVEDALDDDAISRRVLDERLQAQRHRADAAREAIVELDLKIAAAQLRVAKLAEREREFLRDAIIEYADAVFAATYLAKVAELRNALLPILGLCSYLGYGTSAIALPSTNDLSTLKAAPNGALSLRPSNAHAALWAALAKAWSENPFAEPPSLD